MGTEKNNGRTAKRQGMQGAGGLTYKNDKHLKEAIAAYLNSVKTLCPKVTEAELEYIQNGLTVTALKPKHFYIQAGKVQQEIGFVFSGLLRAFYVDDSGHEISVKFIREGNYATHYSAFLTQTPSKYYFQCIEPSILVSLSYHHIQGGYDKYPNIERYGRLVAEDVLKMQQRRIESFLFGNAETRYLDFIAENLDLPLSPRKGMRRACGPPHAQKSPSRRGLAKPNRGGKEIFSCAERSPAQLPGGEALARSDFEAA
jgi:CRP-like cAMP-binding protein